MADISWNWLAPRSSLRELLSANSHAATRPCLPAMESLDDRVLLSIAPGTTTAGDVLVETIKAQIAGRESLFANELSLIDTIASLSTQNKMGKFTAVGKHIDKTVIILREIDDIFYKLNADLIKGDLTAGKENKLLIELNNEFNKLDQIIQDFGTGEQNPLLPIAQSLEEQATSLFTDLSKIKVSVDLSHKDQQLLYKISQDFMLGENKLLKTAEEVALARKAGKGQQEFFVIKMDQVLVSSAKLSDPKLGAEFQALAAEFLQLVSSVSQPGDGTVGVTLVNNTGDVITQPS